MGFVRNDHGGISMADGTVYKEWHGIPEVGIEYYLSINSGRAGQTCALLTSFISKCVSVVNADAWTRTTWYKCTFENGVTVQVSNEGNSHKGFYAREGFVGSSR